MFIAIPTKPRKGDMVKYYGGITSHHIQRNLMFIEVFIGKIEAISADYYWVDFKGKFSMVPKYRVEKYYFGGIEMDNPEFDPNLIISRN